MFLRGEIVVDCSKCGLPTNKRFTDNGKWVCHSCRNPKFLEVVPTMRTVQTNNSKVTIRTGDRFLWNEHKWFILEFPDDDADNVVIKLDGTSDVTLMPEILVAELVDEYHLYEA